jgi:hypothetical protein
MMSNAALHSAAEIVIAQLRTHGIDNPTPISRTALRRLYPYSKIYSAARTERFLGGAQKQKIFLCGLSNFRHRESILSE